MKKLLLTLMVLFGSAGMVYACATCGCSINKVQEKVQGHEHTEEMKMKGKKVCPIGCGCAECKMKKEMDHSKHKMTAAQKEAKNLAEGAKEVVVNVGNKVCPITGAQVGSMGPAVPIEHEGKIYNLCCQGCVGAFKKDPEASIHKINEEMEHMDHPEHEGHE